MRTWEKIQSLLKTESKDFADNLSKAAAGNPTEATFRDKLMPVIDRFCKKAGIEFIPAGGYAMASGGKPDTVFNRLVIEYKALGKLNASNVHPNNKAAQSARFIVIPLYFGLQSKKRNMHDLATKSVYPL